MSELNVDAIADATISRLKGDNLALRTALTEVLVRYHEGKEIGSVVRRALADQAPHDEQEG